MRLGFAPLAVVVVWQQANGSTTTSQAFNQVSVRHEPAAAPPLPFLSGEVMERLLAGAEGVTLPSVWPSESTPGRTNDEHGNNAGWRLGS